ncbi:equilibrative nucleotide transporter [Trifolium repens]|nr:equilibrative nucleotide transporter [Trifolium repens]
MEAVKLVSSDPTETRDAYRVAYIIHFLLNAGNLLPWNAFITAVDYFSYLYPIKYTEKVFSVAYMVSYVLVLLVMMSWGGWNKTTLRLRMNLGFSMFVMSLMVAPVIDWASSSTELKERPVARDLKCTRPQSFLCFVDQGFVKYSSAHKVIHRAQRE